MSFYPTLVFLHVATAILGLGPLTAAAVLASRFPDFPAEQLSKLLRIVSAGLAGVLVTGVAIIAMTHGALGETLWMKTAFALFLLLGALHAMVRVQLRRASLTWAARQKSKSLAGMLWTMCAIVVAITWLMEAKPS